MVAVAVDPLAVDPLAVEAMDVEAMVAKKDLVPLLTILTIPTKSRSS
jgi:hypothetical protein